MRFDNSYRTWAFILCCSTATLVTFLNRDSSAVSPLQTAVLTSSLVVTGPASVDPADVIGMKAGNCAQCHPSEVKAWELTAHSDSTSKLVLQGNGAKYAAALGITESQLSSSICADCHATKSGAGDGAKVISGVSCESCHGGAKDWVDVHWKYSDDMKFTTLAALREAQKAESADHRAARLKKCEEANQIRPEEIGQLARNCLSCHVIDNDKLVAAGHKATSSFDLLGWSSGEMRHNFFMDENTNADVPTLWAANTGLGAAERNRIKLVVGTMAQLEMLLRARGKAKNPATPAQYGGPIFATNGKLTQINGAAPTQEAAAVMGLVAPLAARLFAPMPDDEEFYNKQADLVAEQIAAFLKNHDGTKLGGLDGMIKATQPHNSQFHKSKTGK